MRHVEAKTKCRRLPAFACDGDGDGDGDGETTKGDLTLNELTNMSLDQLACVFAPELAKCQEQAE